MIGGQHALMKHSADKDALRIGLIEDDMFALFNASKAGMDRIAPTPQLRRLGNAHKAFDEAIEIDFCLRFAPRVHRVVDDVGEIKFR